MFLPAAKPRRSMDDKSPRWYVAYVSFSSWSPLEAKETWEVGDNMHMHMDTRVFKVVDFKSDPKFDLGGRYGLRPRGH